MIKAYRSMWKNLKNLKEPAGRKEFWLGQIAHVIVAYLTIIPLGALLLLANSVGINPQVLMWVLVAAEMVFMLVPACSLTIRRARDFGMGGMKTVLYMIGVPVISVLVIGIIRPEARFSALPKMQRAALGLCAAGMGLHMWGVVFFSLLHTSAVSMAGLICLTVGIILGYVVVKAQEAKAEK